MKLKSGEIMNKPDTSANQDATTVGTDIRALRKSRGMTVVDLAQTLDRSAGFISQIERGISQPSISDLRNIAAVFSVPLSFFFDQPPGDPSEARHIVRADQRRKLGAPEAGLIEELLSPDLSGSFEIIRSEFAPGAELSEPQKRDTEEAGYVISGSFEIEIDGTWFELNEGDSFRFIGETYRWRNRTSKPAHLVWVISPPVY